MNASAGAEMELTGLPTPGMTILNTVPQAETLSSIGRYRLLKHTTFETYVLHDAVDTLSGRVVEIKTLRLTPDLTPEQERERRGRFAREAKALSSLTHPNIASALDTGEEQGLPYCVLEPLKGQTLRQLIQTHGALPWDRALEIAGAICSALAYGHARGVIHRDVRPDNIHVLPGGAVKLGGFGLARLTDEPSLTLMGQVIGVAPEYMSPEQVMGGIVDPRTDIFSLGVTLYEMLTGRNPFLTASPLTTGHAVAQTQIEIPQSFPAFLRDLLFRSTAKNLDDRYADAQEMGARLREELQLLTSGKQGKAAEGMRRKVTDPLLKVTTPKATAKPKERSIVGSLPLVLLAGVATAALLAFVVFHLIVSSAPH